MPRGMMRRARGLLAAAAAAVLLAAAAAAALISSWPAAAPPALADTLDDRVYAVASQLMCPVCAGQTVAESDSSVAREMREVIRAKLQAGETPAAILQFFVGQFGESVLAEPPHRGLSLLLYLGPAAGVAGGLAIAVLLIRRWTGGAGGSVHGETADGASRSGSARAGARGRTGPGGARPADSGERDAGVSPGEAGPGELDRLARELEARDRF